MNNGFSTCSQKTSSHIYHLVQMSQSICVNFSVTNLIQRHNVRNGPHKN